MGLCHWVSVLQPSHSFKISGTTRPTTQHYLPEDLILQENTVRTSILAKFTSFEKSFSKTTDDKVNPGLVIVVPI